MNWVQYIFDGFKATVARRKTTTYGLRFVWQLTPITILAVMYYTNIDFMEEDDPYLVRLYDLKTVNIIK